MGANGLRRAVVATVIVAGALWAASGQADSGSTAASCAPGEHRLQLGGGRTALMLVTAGGKRGRKALILVLHGAGGDSLSGLWAFRGGLEEPGVVMLAPASTGPTWSAVYGSDVDLAHVNRALAQTFARCRIDRRRTAVGGFSDGATYALSLGLTNGDLFRAVMALSPGGAQAERTVGRPRVFVAHGTRDAVLPIAQTSDVIVRKLRLQGYTVKYRRFKGGHEAPEEISRAAVRWFLRG